MRHADHNKHILLTVSSDNINVNNDMSRYRHVNIQELHLCNRYNNISSELGNNQLFYDTLTSIILDDGFYNIDTLNNLLLPFLHKIVQSSNGINYSMLQYGNINDWNTEQNSIADKTLIVNTLSILNEDIYNGEWPGQLLYMNISGVQQFKNVSNNNIVQGNEFIVPLVNTYPGQIQSIYFNDNIWYENLVATELQIKFFDQKRRLLQFYEPYPKLVLQFDNAH